MPPVLVLAATNGSGKQEGAIAANVESTNLAAAKVPPRPPDRVTWLHGSIDRLVRSRIVINCYPLFFPGRSGTVSQDNIWIMAASGPGLGALVSGV